MAIIQIRIEDSLKDQAVAIYDGLGLDLSTAVRMFMKQSVIQKGLPFSVKLKPDGQNAMERIIKECQNISKQNGNDKMTMDDINAFIAKCHKEKKNGKK
ncbi:MAG: type II toxin-antitoxin system RelB/DinJ family antitoxin [Bacilli bacterium]|nr:type II toxin-antitoxin system RelB/DinJ family antitoxin [Bacilli bacterium]